MEQYVAVGARFPRIDGPPLASGQGQFSCDISLPGTLYAKVLRSPLAHARVLHIDTSKAERLPGVKAVVIGKDTSGLPYTYWVELLDPTVMDKHPLAMDKVRHVGDEVAAVAAVDEETAQEALELIQVDYEELPAVFDPEEAMKPEAPLIHEKERNVSIEIHLVHGDVEKAFSQSDHIREERFVSPPISHCVLEPHNCLAHFDSSGKLAIWSATQSPISVRTHLSRLLGLPPSQVRVITPHVGGGFGGRAEMMGFE